MASASSPLRTFRRLLWAALAAAGLAVFALRSMEPPQASTQGDLGQLPSFSLLDQRGQPISDRDLRGQAAVINFIYTRCPSVCPMLTAKFKALQDRLGGLQGVRYVSISVDPEHDTPQVLSEYAARFQAGPSWLFLTGPLEQIEKTVVQGFKIHMGKPTPNPNDPTLMDIMHGEHFVLVDQGGALRGYFPSDAEGQRELEAALRSLLP